MNAPFEKIRLRSKEQADAHIGSLVQYETADGTEYGRLIRAVPTQAVLERLLRTGEQTFVAHPEPVCARSKNAVNFSRTLWLLIPKEVMDPVALPEVEEVIDPVALPEQAEQAEEIIDPVAVEPGSSRSSSRSSSSKANRGHSNLSRYGAFFNHGDKVLLTRKHSGKPTAEELAGKQYEVIKTHHELLFIDPESKEVFSSPSGLCVAKLQREGETNQWQGPAHMLLKVGATWTTLKAVMGKRE